MAGRPLRGGDGRSQRAAALQGHARRIGNGLGRRRRRPARTRVRPAHAHGRPARPHSAAAARVGRLLPEARRSAPRPHVQTITDDLLDDIARRGPDSRVDLVAAFAFPLPFTVICELLGVPQARPGLAREGFTKLLVPTSTADEYAAAKEASDAVVAMLDEPRRRQARSTPATISSVDLISARDGDERLDNQELLSTIFQLIVAGHDTTASLIGNSVVALFRNPAQLAELRADPARIP